MDLLDQVDGIEQIAFARSRGPAPDIDSSRRSVFADDYSATRAGIQIVRMPDSDVIYVREGYLLHAVPPYLNRRQDQPRSLSMDVNFAFFPINRFGMVT